MLILLEYGISKKIMKEIQTDILIVGGGLTGLLAGYSLSQKNFKITLLDRENLLDLTKITKDYRTTAIAEGSKVFFEEIGLWKYIEKYAEPIKDIRVFDRSANNKIDFKNTKKNNFLGYVVKNYFLKTSLIKLLKKSQNIKILDKTSLNNILVDDTFIIANTKKNILKSKILIAADGKNSFTRSLLKTNIYKKDYNHTATIINLSHSVDLKNIAYEIFLKSGPLAILPMKSSKESIYASSIIWSNETSFSNSFSRLDLPLQKEIIQERTSDYIGNINKIYDIKHFNLSAHLNLKFYDERVVYVGDSAHSLHPIAGQGWNLGIRDIKNLLHTIDQDYKSGLDIGSRNTCLKYHNLSFYDAYLLFQITDKLNSIFLNNNKIISNFRNLGFSFIHNNNELKNRITSYAMGF